jgi:hypothetical protein
VDNPRELDEFAVKLMHEAGKVRGLAAHEAALPGRIDFESPGALRLFANMGEVADSFAVAATALEDAAHAIAQRSDSIRNAQADWQRQRTRSRRCMRPVRGCRPRR